MDFYLWKSMTPCNDPRIIRQLDPTQQPPLVPLCELENSSRKRFRNVTPFTLITLKKKSGSCCAIGFARVKFTKSGIDAWINLSELVPTPNKYRRLDVGPLSHP